jgi:hypothetical protein
MFYKQNLNFNAGGSKMHLKSSCSLLYTFCNAIAHISIAVTPIDSSPEAGMVFELT